MCIGAHDKHFLLEKELLGNALHPGILVLNNIIQVDLQLYPQHSPLHHKDVLFPESHDTFLHGQGSDDTNRPKLRQSCAEICSQRFHLRCSIRQTLPECSYHRQWCEPFGLSHDAEYTHLKARKAQRRGGGKSVFCFSELHRRGQHIAFQSDHNQSRLDSPRHSVRYRQ